AGFGKMLQAFVDALQKYRPAFVILMVVLTRYPAMQCLLENFLERFLRLQRARQIGEHQRAALVQWLVTHDQFLMVVLVPALVLMPVTAQPHGGERMFRRLPMATHAATDNAIRRINALRQCLAKNLRLLDALLGQRIVIAFAPRRLAMTNQINCCHTAPVRISTQLVGAAVRPRFPAGYVGAPVPARNRGRTAAPTLFAFDCFFATPVQVMVGEPEILERRVARLL